MATTTGRARPRPPRRSAPGFTLVEVLVALFVMSLLALLGWQGIDGMVRTRDASQRRLDATLRLDAVLAQWREDLAAVQDGLAVPALRCTGNALYLTRRAPGGLQLVVWALRGGRWQRWTAPPTPLGRALQDAWMRSQQLVGTEAGQLTLVEGVSDWQIYFFRNNAWSNCQSSGDLTVAPVITAPPPAPGTAVSAPVPAAARVALPGGVRLVLSFAPGGLYTGSVTRDVLLAAPP